MSKKQRPSRTKTGREGEQKVAAALRNQGFKPKLSTGSRGPADVIAQKGPEKLLVQVKTSRGGTPTKPSAEEQRRLQALAGATGAVPAVARVSLSGKPRIKKRTRKTKAR